MKKYSLSIHEQAILEARESYAFYEEQQKGLGERFLSEIEKGIYAIQHYPRHYRIIKKGFRQYQLSTFPFVLVYILHNEEVLVQCVFHTSRNPKDKFKMEIR
jgi:hypothetical protein